MQVRLLDVVLPQRRVDRKRVGKALTQQLPHGFAGQLDPLLRRKLAGERDLQLRVGTSVLALMVVRRLPKGV